MLVNHRLSVRAEIDALEAASRPGAVLGLDPGLRTGVALVRAGAALFTSEIDIRSEWALRPGRGWRAFERALADLLAEHRPSLIVAELPTARGHASAIPVTVLAIADAVADLYEIALRPIAVNSVRSRVFGNGRLSKERARDELRARGFRPENGHQADALAVALAAEMAATPRRRRAKA